MKRAGSLADISSCVRSAAKHPLSRECIITGNVSL